MCIKSYIHDRNMLYLYGILMYRNKIPACVTKYIAEYIDYQTCNPLVMMELQQWVEFGRMLVSTQILIIPMIKNMKQNITRRKKLKKLKYKIYGA